VIATRIKEYFEDGEYKINNKKTEVLSASFLRHFPVGPYLHLGLYV
jgi:hypothetical protein